MLEGLRVRAESSGLEFGSLRDKSGVSGPALPLPVAAPLQPRRLATPGRLVV